LQRHVQPAQARQVANVAAKRRMLRMVQGGADGQLGISVGQVQQSLSHASGRAVDADEGLGHEYTSIALMISSRSLGTCTGRLAKLARRTPRRPSTCSNCSGSAL